MRSRRLSLVTHLRFRNKVADLFGIDPRTLALARIAIAAVLMLNLATRALDLRLMYSDTGLYPIADVAKFWGPDTWRWSFHMLAGSTAYQGFLFAAAGLFALCLLLGWQTRIATIASWLLLVSLHTRVPALVTGGDVLILMMLFWGMFLPWGRCASIDAWRRGDRAGSAPVVSVASAAILLQIGFMYFFTGFSKCNYLWLEGKALESVFQNPLFTRPLGEWFASYPTLLGWLTRGTLVLELVGPPLMFCPWKTRFWRALIVSCFVALHIGIELTMHVVIFSYASLAALTLFTPGTFWSRSWISLIAGRLPENATAGHIVRYPRLQRIGTAAGTTVCLVALAYVAIVNPIAYFGTPALIQRIPSGVQAIRDVGCLDQEWSMFSCPAIHNYRFVILATLRDGTQMDLLRNEPFAEVDRPEALSLHRPSARWVQILIDLARPHSQISRISVIRYFAHQWNANHAPPQQVEHVQLALLYEKNSHDPEGPGIDKVVLARFDPFAQGEYREGHREGHWTFRYPDGQVEATGDFRGGREQGRWTLWYPDGRKQGEGSYVDGQMEGKWTFWYEGGERVEAYFSRGRVIPRPLAISTSTDSPK
ncbi:MAG: HTTM domain-containing protein [Pirellulaceae bacterium]